MVVSARLGRDVGARRKARGESLEYVVDVKRVIARKLKLVEADGALKADGEVVYQVTDMKVALSAT